MIREGEFPRKSVRHYLLKENECDTKATLDFYNHVMFIKTVETCTVEILIIIKLYCPGY